MRSVPDSVRFLLLQIRDDDDAELPLERGCFARAIHCSDDQIDTVSLLNGGPTTLQVRQSDVVLIGGAGRYSAASNKPLSVPPSGDRAWLNRSLDLMRELFETRKPTFASCWGFQAMSRALGGEVLNDPDAAEVGTILLRTTVAAASDPVFSCLGREFLAQIGHEDQVVAMPRGAILMASSDRVKNQAFSFPDRPIVATQFHPELALEDMLRRVRAYPEYVERIKGISYEEFASTVEQTKAATELLRQFVVQVLDV